MLLLLLLLLLLHAEAGSDGDKLSLVTIGDKGRAQLQRLAPDKIKLSIQDTYKDKVTFSQVRGGVC
jgi:hypothetical protein